MSTRSKYRVLLLLVGAPLGFFLVKVVERHCLAAHSVHISCVVSVEKPTTLVIHHADGHGWRPDHQVKATAPGGNQPHLVRFPMIHTDSLAAFQLSIDDSVAQIELWAITLVAGVGTIIFPMDTTRMSIHDLAFSPGLPDGPLTFTRTGPAPQLQFDHGFDDLDLNRYSRPDKMWMSGLLALLLSLMAWSWFRPAPKWLGPVPMHQLVFSHLFMGGLLVHWYCLPTGLSQVDPYLERRTLAPFPSDTTTRYAAGLGAWLVDGFAIRQQLTHLHGLMDYFWLDRSTLPHKTVLGRNKELYPSSLFLLDDFMGKMTLSDAQLASIRRNLTERILYMRSQGKEYYLLFTPSKQTIYPDDLPSRYRKQHRPERTMLSQLVSYLEKDTLVAQYICDPRPALLDYAAISDNRLYFQNDIHWNGLGAYIGYQQLIHLVNLRHPSIKMLGRSEFTITKGFDHEGDLARLLMLQREVPRTIYTFHKKRGPNFTKEMEPSEHPFLVCHTTLPDTTLPTALVFRDSFCEDLIPFLSCHFSDVLYVWDQKFDVDLIERRNPDFVIQELTEMFIYELLTVNPKSIQDHG